jgi:L-fucose mutarotase
MLKGISSLISPELLKVLSEMGHADEIVLADAHFPGKTFGSHVIRADGLMIPELLDAILPLFELDSYVPTPLFMIDVVPGDTPDPEVESSYLSVVKKHAPEFSRIEKIERFDFYDRVKSSFAVVMTGDTGKYGNLILKKGVTPC